MNHLPSFLCYLINMNVSHRKQQKRVKLPYMFQHTTLKQAGGTQTQTENDPFMHQIFNISISDFNTNLTAKEHVLNALPHHSQIIARHL